MLLPIRNEPHHVTSKPTIVALHGFLASAKYWNRLQPLLTAAGFRLLSIDLLGFGKAPKPTDSLYDYSAHIAYIKETLEKHAVKEPFILMGHSMGALIAAKYAVLYPQAVARTILLHPPLYSDRNQVQETLKGTGLHYRFLLDSRFRGIGWGILRNLPFLAVASHTKFSRERSFANVIEAAEIFSDLEAITAPTLLINGTRDRQVYTRNLQLLQAQPSLQVSVQPVAHHSPIRNTRLIAGIVIDFANA